MMIDFLQFLHKLWKYSALLGFSQKGEKVVSISIQFTSTMLIYALRYYSNFELLHWLSIHLGGPTLLNKLWQMHTFLYTYNQSFMFTFACQLENDNDQLTKSIKSSLMEYFLIAQQNTCFTVQTLRLIFWTEYPEI